ncbi:MAG: iron-containing alcohol dehydrogenase [Acidobacteriota bacterium]|nr:iron-containing alcohol dehydrogenase [Acidobacteriota bacterium]
MEPFDFHSSPRVIFGLGVFERLPQIARELKFSRTLLVADSGMVACGYVEQAMKLLASADIIVFPFHDFGENPDTQMIEAGRAFAALHNVDSIIALGGGSSLDCAKGIGFVLSGGGTMRDYWGHGKLSAKLNAEPMLPPMLPMIGIPTTAGTGSDAQSYTLISDAETHVKMACGDDQAVFKAVLLDPQLTVTMPRSLTAITGYDAIAHAVESFVTRKRNPISDLVAREAWRLLEANYERVLAKPTDIEARGAMLLGSYYAGLAIENSMLGATHACANPLTKNYDTTHGVAIGLILPHVVRWNRDVAGRGYKELAVIAGLASNSADEANAVESLARRLEQLRNAGGLPNSLGAIGIAKSDLPKLAEEAAKQWTGGFNPRDWNFEGAMEVYEKAL